MNVAGINPAAGGPVGAGMMANNNMSAAANCISRGDFKCRLDTYIYDYFLKIGYYDHARALLRDDSVKINTIPNAKTSPGRRRDAEMNGVDDSAMDGDSGAGKIPDDLPKANVPDNNTGGFLFDWFCLFCDIFGASRNKRTDDASTAAQYLQQTQRNRENQHLSSVLGRPGGPPNRALIPPNMRNGMTPEMHRAMATKNMTPAQLQAWQQKQQQQHAMAIQREQAENEHRPQSPASTENAGSPSKRQRLEGQQFPNGPMAPNRGQGGPSMNLLMANGMGGRGLTQAPFQSFQAQNPGMQKNLQVYAHQLAQQQGRSVMNQGVPMPNSMMNSGVMPGQGSPMMGPVDGQSYMAMDALYHPQMAAALRQQQANGMATANGQGGNHALQDYQMQLMLLEQQNKKRLMMARQEQDSLGRDGGPPIPGQPGGLPQGQSPGSRNGTSPNPNEQMKQGNSQLGANGIPASPSAADGMPQARGSPAGMNFAAGMPQDYNQQMFMKNQMEGIAGPGAPGMRPPTSMNAGMNMEALSRQQSGRVPSGGWPANGQGQPMMQPTQAKSQAIGTPQQRNGVMPPPSAPATGNGANPRNAPPASPPGQAPPTPSQTNKANPKGKKDKGETKKRPSKKNSTANAPTAADGDTAATPNPSTPITPGNQASFPKGSGAPANGNATAAANATTASNQSAPQQPSADLGAVGGNGDVYTFPGSNEINMDFTLDNDNVLANFDFDTYLHNDDNEATFAFDPMNFAESLETGME